MEKKVRVLEKLWVDICKTIVLLAWIQRAPPPPLKNHKNIEFLCNFGPDPLKSYKATKLEFNIRPSLERQRFRWRADDGPLIVVLDSTKKPKHVITLTKLSTFWIRACFGNLFWSKSKQLLLK